MSIQLPSTDLEASIADWRSYLRQHTAIGTGDADELEDHLRSQIGDLTSVGLSPDEAFLIAVSRLGSVDDVSREFAREHSDRLWKQLVRPSDDERARRQTDLTVALALACGAALAITVPTALGRGLASGDGAAVALNLSLFVLPFLAGYFAWKRGMPRGRAVALLVPPFAVAAVVANAVPYVPGGATQLLVAIHLPVAMWCVVSVAYMGGEWQSHRRRMDVVRFTGEWAVYYALLALGGGVLLALTGAGFALLDLGGDVTVALAQWVLPAGAMGAVIVAAWLVEAKQSVVENMAPVLTRVFTPLATLMLVAFLVGAVLTGGVVRVDRALLILVDLVLVLVLGLLLYAVSARDPDAPAGLFDRLQLALVVSALLVDVLMLAAMAGRIAEFGVSPNKAAALGLNLVLLVNLGRSAWLQVGLVRGRRPAADLERWQTTYLPVFAVWAVIVVVVFPPLFAFA